MKVVNNILVINGPNINLLGKRELHIYGKETYESLCKRIEKFAEDNQVNLEIFQSNHEGVIIDKIQDAEKDFSGIVINAGAFTHYSFAIKDAIGAIGIPVVEVHVSNIFNREAFRHISVITDVCVGQICGFGYRSYLLGISALLDHFPGYNP